MQNILIINLYKFENITLNSNTREFSEYSKKPLFIYSVKPHSL